MSFDEAYKTYYKELRRFSHQLNHSVVKSEDLVQETFLKFYIELGKKSTIKNPRAWLYKVLLNSFRTQFTSDKQELQVIETINNHNDPSFDLQTDLSKVEKQEIVLRTLDTLPERTKELLVLYNNGFSYAEMAEIMELNPASVGKTLVRAIEKLKEILKVHYHEMFEQN